VSTPKYPSYKDVPIPWIASIPEHWDWKPVLGAACERDEDNKGMKEDNLLSLSYGNIVNKDINTSDGLLPESFETYQIVRPGDIVLRLTDLQNDKRSLRSALVTQTGIITSAYLALKPESIDPKYLGYLLRAYDVSKVFYSMGGGLRQSMKYGDIKRMPLVIPTKAEQSDIASFLDRETAKIDALIAEQQRLIKLLQEKRQAVISHAVTKGLNPNAPMKDSGVEWLGAVPEHWEVKPLKYLANVQTGMAKGKDLDGVETADIPYLRVANVQDGYLELDEVHLLPVPIESISKYLLRTGDVLMNEGGDFDKLGRGCIWSGEIEPCVHQNHVFAVRPHSISGEWLNAYTTSKAANSYFIGRSKQSTNLASISSTNLMGLSVPVPPSEEASEILGHMNVRVQEIDDLKLSATQAVELLQERRSALISAAVTGQIDVRGLAEAEAGKQ
jgi:type I restriction enzyme S subunit